MTNAEPFHEADSTWQALIGKAIVRFGDIEMISFRCLAHIPRDQISESAARLEFSRRVDFLIEVIEGRQPLDPNMQELLSGFKRAKILARTRNLIAHNPVMLDIYVGMNGDDVRTEHIIRSARSAGQTLNLEQLKEFAAEIEDLSSSLWMAFIRLTNSSDGLWRSNA